MNVNIIIKLNLSALKFHSRYDNIKKIVSGMDAESLKEIKNVYDIVIKVGTFPVSTIKTAEAIKVVENSQRDINIAFMNELSKIFNAMGIILICITTYIFPVLSRFQMKKIQILKTSLFMSTPKIIEWAKQSERLLPVPVGNCFSRKRTSPSSIIRPI